MRSIEDDHGSTLHQTPSRLPHRLAHRLPWSFKIPEDSLTLKVKWIVNCKLFPNAEQSDSDAYGIGDGVDNDGDGLNKVNKVAASRKNRLTGLQGF